MGSKSMNSDLVYGDNAVESQDQSAPKITWKSAQFIKINIF